MVPSLAAGFLSSLPATTRMFHPFQVILSTSEDLLHRKNLGTKPLELKEMRQQRFIMRFVAVSKWGH
jgi:hypothetical protein